MYNMHKTKDRIKDLCKSKNIKMETLLTDCGLGINAIRQINEKKGMGSYSLARIADYLSCSVDYLLGRTDEPSTISNVIGGNVQRGFSSVFPVCINLACYIVQILLPIPTGLHPIHSGSYLSF